MNVKEFKKKSASRHKLQFSDKAYGGLPWEDWYKLTNMTNKIDYGCCFRDDGTCVQTRRGKERGVSPNEMCCCRWCASDIGYLDFIQNDPGVIAKISGYFKAEVGFWRKGKGCSLPRKYRSVTCLGYRCYDSDKAVIHGNAAILMAFINAIKAHTISNSELRKLGKTLTDIDV